MPEIHLEYGPLTLNQRSAKKSFRMSNKKSSLKIQLAIGIAVLAIVSSFISSNVASRFSREQIERDQSALLQNIAIRMTSQLTQDMQARGNEIAMLSNQELIRDKKISLEKKL